MTAKNRKIVGIWLLVGAFMVFIQVIIGGITRLTESGLSITEWEVVTGTIPPLTQEAWEEVFAAYQQSPEYQQVNQGMTLSEFKTIYFWEYFHRLWARLLGFVFLIPFVYFLYRKLMDRSTIKKALIAFGLGGLAGVFGWLMVMSGLDERPMVSPYRLATHLAIAISTLVYLVWVAMGLLWSKEPERIEKQPLRKWLLGLIVITAFQILVGALVSGMEAAPVYPTWPDMNNAFIPSVMLEAGNWSWNAFVNFDKAVLPHAVVQFIHRNTAYLMVILGAGISWKAIMAKQFTLSKPTKSLFVLIPVILLVQALLGISILLTVTAHIPVVLGVVHQAVAILLLVVLVLLEFRLK